MPGDYETLLVELDRGVATVAFNRPERMNAFNHTMTVEFPKAMQELEADDGVRVIVVTGAGRGFCAGIDLMEGGAQAFGANAHGKVEEDQKLGVTAESIAKENAFWEWRTPIIAAINGAAIGAGLTLPMLFDIRIAAEDAKLAFRFTRLGITPEANSTWILPRLIGTSRALELLMTGRTFTGREAAEVGIVSRAVPADEVLPAALEIAHDIADNTAPASIAITKRLVYRSLQDVDRMGAFVTDTNVTWWAGELPDAMEGIFAYIQKRPANWSVSKHIALPKEID